jgi:hypothetical protein
MNKFVAICVFMMVCLVSFGQTRRTAASNQAAKASTKKEEAKPAATKNTENKKTKVASTDEAAAEEKTPSKDYSGKAFLSPKVDASRMSTVIELGGFPSDADITMINVYGHLGLNFDLGKTRRIHFGPYFRHKILSTHEYQVIKHNNIDYEVSSLKDWGTGLNFGIYFPLGKTMLIDPELRIGYNEFTIQNPNFSDVNPSFIYRNYINFTPRVNLGFKLSDYTILNLHGGYTLPYFLNNSESVPHFNPATFHYGLGVRFYLMK